MPRLIKMWYLRVIMLVSELLNGRVPYALFETRLYRHLIPGSYEHNKNNNDNVFISILFITDRQDREQAMFTKLCCINDNWIYISGKRYGIILTLSFNWDCSFFVIFCWWLMVSNYHICIGVAVDFKIKQYFNNWTAWNCNRSSVWVNP